VEGLGHVSRVQRGTDSGEDGWDMGDDTTVAPFGCSPKCVVSYMVEVIMSPLTLGITKDIAELSDGSSATISIRDMYN
jgi:hypothetical protein